MRVRARLDELKETAFPGIFDKLEQEVFKVLENHGFTDIKPTKYREDALHDIPELDMVAESLSHLLLDLVARQPGPRRVSSLFQPLN